DVVRGPEGPGAAPTVEGVERATVGLPPVVRIPIQFAVLVGADHHVDDAVAVEVAEGGGGVERRVHRGPLRPAGGVGAVIEVESPHLVGVAADVTVEAAVEGPGAGDDLEPPVAVDVADGRAALECLGTRPLPELTQCRSAVVGQRPENAAAEGVVPDRAVRGGVAPDEDLRAAVTVDVVEGR